MRFIDTHAHLYLSKFDSDREAVLERARASGLDAVFLPNIDRSSVASLHALADAHPGFCYPMMGVHPCSIDDAWEAELAAAEALLFEPGARRYIAVGEIGLDYYWDRSHEAAQREAYRRQIDWALRLGIPIVVHSRDSLDDTIDIAAEQAARSAGSKANTLRGVFHCFNGTVEQGRRIRDLGCCLGIGGVVTYKNAGVAEVMSELGPDGVVLETDAPYLSPVPYRGKRNESAYVRLVAEKLAECWDMPLAEVARRSYETSLELFSSVELHPAR